MDALLIATRNKGKIREIREILKDIPSSLLSLTDVGFEGEIPETGKTFEENAIIKARTVGEKTGLMTLAEDSGLEVDALGAKPGVHSARYVDGTDNDRLEKVLRELEGVPQEKRTARFKTVVVLYNPATRKIQTFEGKSEGYITRKPIGTNGFGYDPIFFNSDLGKTNGEASFGEKNRISHRARALKKLKAWYQSNEDLFRP